MGKLAVGAVAAVTHQIDFRKARLLDLLNIDISRPRWLTP